MLITKDGYLMTLALAVVGMCSQRTHCVQQLVHASTQQEHTHLLYFELAHLFFRKKNKNTQCQRLG